MAQIVFSFTTSTTVREAAALNLSIRQLGDAFADLTGNPSDAFKVRRGFTAIQRGVELGLTDVVRRSAVVAAGELGQRTPIDTGNAVSSWTPSVTVPIIVEETARPSRSRGRLRARARREFTALRFGLDAFIGNGVPYIERLEDGHSQQAPSGFTAQTVTGVLRWLRSQGRRAIEAPIRQAARRFR